MDVNQNEEFGIPETQTQPEPELPPPGYKRDQELAMRKDLLQEEQDKRSDQHIPIDPSKMEVENEIRNEIEKGYMTPSNANPAFVYLWVQCKHPADHPSRMVERKKAEKVWIPTEQRWERPWEIVGAEHQEARECYKPELGACRIGDVLLMRCRKDYHTLMELEKKKRNYERNFGTDSGLVEVALNAGAQGGHAAYDKYNPGVANQTLFGNEFQMKLDHAMRTGTLPGMEINRR